uniref:Mediator of RNA polymerase II transcription subunit 20 n=2 Tax=Aegilops tauschii subsp. strangulata TaxID=200361 RepID=A0A453KTG1_AEGTS
GISHCPARRPAPCEDSRVKTPPSPLLAGAPPTRRHGPRQVVPCSRLSPSPLSSHGAQPPAHPVSAFPRRRLMHWHPNPGVTLNTQILSEACGCAESLGGTKDGRWKTSIIFYRPMTRDGAGGAQQNLPPDVPRELLGVALHERPGLYFSILRNQRLVLQADAAFSQVMEKLQSFKARVNLNFEGFQYQLGDFCLRIGKCVPNNTETLRGIMMEVEYYPLSSIEKSRAIMVDFFDIWQETLAKKSLPGRFIHVESNFAEYGLSDHYSFQHTAVQYATCLQQLMAAVRA